MVTLLSELGGKKVQQQHLKVLRPPVIPAKIYCHRNYSALFPEPENGVGPKCVCVCMSGCAAYMCTYMYNIYLQYILYISIS